MEFMEFMEPSTRKHKKSNKRKELPWKNLNRLTDRPIKQAVIKQDKKQRRQILKKRRQQARKDACSGSAMHCKCSKCVASRDVLQVVPLDLLDNETAPFATSLEKYPKALKFEYQLLENEQEYNEERLNNEYEPFLDDDDFYSDECHCLQCWAYAWYESDDYDY